MAHVMNVERETGLELARKLVAAENQIDELVNALERVIGLAEGGFRYDDIAWQSAHAEARTALTHAARTKAGLPWRVQRDAAPKVSHMTHEGGTVCGAPIERGNSYYEWAYVDCVECLSKRLQGILGA